MAPEQNTLTGSARRMWRIRSKKWQHFSTIVPPVLRLKRFQSATLTRKGKRCSRIVSMTARPTSPAWTRSTKRVAGGMKRYSIPVQNTAERSAARSAAQAASATVVHSGFSHRMARWEANSGSSTARWVKLGEATMTASSSAPASISAAVAKVGTAGAERHQRLVQRGPVRIGEGHDRGRRRTV